MKKNAQGQIEAEAGDILECDKKTGRMYIRAPTRWDKAKSAVIYPVLGVVLFPVRLVYEAYWALVWWWRNNRA